MSAFLSNCVQAIRSYLQPTQHPDPALQKAWNWTQWGFLWMPFLPIVGIIGVLGGLTLVTRAKAPQILSRPITKALSILALGFITTVFTAANPGDAALGLANFLPYFWLMAGYGELMQSTHQLQRMAELLVWPSAIVIFLGLAELGGLAIPPWLTWLIPGPLQAYGTPPGRMSASLGYANILACYLSLTFVLCLGLLSSHLTTPKTQDCPRVHSRAPLWAWVLITSFNGLGLILTQSRSAWGVAAGAALIFAFYLGWRSLVAGVLGLMTTVFWAAFGPATGNPLRSIIPRYFWGRLNDDLYPNRPTADLRISQWQFALDLIHQRPLTGWGLRNFTPLYQNHSGTWLGHPHNLFLMLGAETGVVNTTFLTFIVGITCYQGIHLFLEKRKNNCQFDQSIFLATLIGFGSCVIFHSFDVPLFDSRINILGTTFFSMILGVVYYSSNAGNISLGERGGIKIPPPE